MGTTLTGTTPQDTYDSLIKVTDNAPLTGSLKKLTDGLGNDSSLSLSTTAASLSGTLAVSGNATFDTNTLFVDAANNRVGIGTASPADGVLNLASATQFGTTICHTFLTVGAAATKVTSNGAYAIGVDAADGSTERMRITSAGRVGINVSDPNATLVVKNSAADTRLELDTEVAGTSILSYNRATLAYKEIYLRGSIIQFNPNDVNRVTVTTNGLTFNGDTAAANALDDYEEGTFTPTIAGSTTAGTASYISQVGVYTKIGRIVKFSITINYNSGTGTGNLQISGLPFTALAAGANSAASIGALGDVALSALHIATAIVPNNSIIIAFEQYPTGGGSSIAVPYDAAGVILISGTYEV